MVTVAVVPNGVNNVIPRDPGARLHVPPEGDAVYVTTLPEQTDVVPVITGASGTSTVTVTKAGKLGQPPSVAITEYVVVTAGVTGVTEHPGQRTAGDQE